MYYRCNKVILKCDRSYVNSLICIKKTENPTISLVNKDDGKCF